jgi:hypothetical protein
MPSTEACRTRSEEAKTTRKQPRQHSPKSPPLSTISFGVAHRIRWRLPRLNRTGRPFIAPIVGCDQRCSRTAWFRISTHRGFAARWATSAASWISAEHPVDAGPQLVARPRPPCRSSCSLRVLVLMDCFKLARPCAIAAPIAWGVAAAFLCAAVYAYLAPHPILALDTAGLSRRWSRRV